jgi:aspartate 1-decarboxylase
MDASNLIEGEKSFIVNINNGERSLKLMLLKVNEIQVK